MDVSHNFINFLYFSQGIVIGEENSQFGLRINGGFASTVQVQIMWCDVCR
jgi:hypothetical protein